MSHPQWRRIVAEWRQNRRLRFGAMLIVFVAGLHLVLSLSDQRTAGEAQFMRDAELLSSLEEASRESAWLGRAAEATSRLDAVRGSIPQARSDGLAQAELQAWLTELAATTGLADPRVRVETSLAVPGEAGIWQVLARLDANVPEGAAPALLRALAQGLPWIRAERLELKAGRETRLSVVVRGYYRQEDAAPGGGESDLPAVGADGVKP